jgi:hypothetical protein
MGTLGLLGFGLFSLLPELRRLQRRVRELETAAAASAYAETDLDDPNQEPTEPRPSFLSRLRGPATGELPSDNYDDELDPPYSSH